MNDDTANADAAQQQDILRQRLIEAMVDGVAAQFDDHRLAGETAHIGNGLDEQTCGVSGGEAVEAAVLVHWTSLMM